MQLDLNQLCELLSVLDSTSISELTLKSADFELTLRKGVPAGELGSIAQRDPALEERLAHRPASSDPATVGTVASSGLVAPPPVTIAPSVDSGARGTTAVSAGGGPGPIEPKWVPVPSPMVGTFYRSPTPDEPPFVEVGDRIRIGQTVCIIEAMKLMNELEAEVSGLVMEILVQNGEPVEYGQTLMRIHPD